MSLFVFLVFVWMLGEVPLQIVRPTALEQIRDRTFRVARKDADYVTLQPDNYDPKSGQFLTRLDTDLFWRATAQVEGSFFGTPFVSINDSGFRSPNWPDPSEETTRLLFLGDSVTFGYGVDRDQRYSDKLIVRLKQRYPERDWTSVNAAMIGYSSFQGKVVAREVLRQIQPDAVFVCFGVNDCLQRPLSDSDFSQEMQSSYAQFRTLMRRSQIVVSLEASIAYATRALSGETEKPLSHFLYYPGGRPESLTRKVPRNSPEEVIANLADIEAQCRRFKIPLVVLDQFALDHEASKVSLGPSFLSRLQSLAGHLEQWAMGRGHTFVSTRRVIGSESPPTRWLLDSCHPTPKGHTLIADAILEHLIQTDWVDTLPPQS